MRPPRQRSSRTRQRGAPSPGSPGARLAGRRRDGPARGGRGAQRLAVRAAERAPAQQEAGGLALLGRPAAGAGRLSGRPRPPRRTPPRRRACAAHPPSPPAPRPRPRAQTWISRSAGNPSAGQPRRVQVVAPQHPDQLAAAGQRHGEPRDEGGARRGGLQFQPFAGELVPGLQRQPAARQQPVQPRIAEADRPRTRPSPPLPGRRSRRADRQGSCKAEGMSVQRSCSYFVLELGGHRVKQGPRPSCHTVQTRVRVGAQIAPCANGLRTSARALPSRAAAP